MKYIKLFENHSQYEDFTETENFVKPNVSRCLQEKDIHYNPINFSEKYLTYKILNDNTNVQITISSDFDTTAISYISYSTDHGNSWTTINNEDNKSSDLTHSFVANSGDYIMWRGEAQALGAYNSSENGGYINGCKIQCGDEYNVFGNIMSLLYGDSFYGEYSLIDRDYCFAGLFKNEPIISAENFVLPATTLANYCYIYMFYGCTNLTNVPKLPATNLNEAIYCYQNMFAYCTSLTTPPELPAITLAHGCYSNMFTYCTNLTTTPELSATTLAQYCYSGMFSRCTSLTTPPNLPAIILAQYCYLDMFRGCTSLITAPVLPAETLVNNCYRNMFYECINLTTPPVLPATTLASSCYSGIFYGCTSLTMAPELSATRLVSSCYSNMFDHCTSLTTAPELPATTLATFCYQNMFKGCTSLMTSPDLPATTLAEYCYDSMFYGTDVLPDCTNIDFTSQTIVKSGGLIGLFAGTKVTDSDLNNILPKNNNKFYLPVTNLSGGSQCYSKMFEDCTNLTTAPELPAETLADTCYNRMFEGCTNLTTAPELPSTTLAERCYEYMFNGCTSLMIAPELPATILKRQCYYGMFQGCTNLNSITCLATDISANNCTWHWVYSVASSGTFVKSANMSSWKTGSSGIPTNWVVQTVNE